MEERTADLPVRPVTNEQGYLSAILTKQDEILGELRAMRKALAPPAPEGDDDLFDDDEVVLREPSPGAR